MIQKALLSSLMKESPGLLLLEKHTAKNLLSPFPCHAFQEPAFLTIVYLQAKKRSLIFDFGNKLLNFTLSYLLKHTTYKNHQNPNAVRRGLAVTKPVQFLCSPPSYQLHQENQPHTLMIHIPPSTAHLNNGEGEAAAEPQ